MTIDAATTIEDFQVGNRILVQWSPDKHVKPWVVVKPLPKVIEKDADGKESTIKKPICELLLTCSRNEIYSNDKDGKKSRRMGIKKKVERKKVEKKKGCLNCFKPKDKDDQEKEDWGEQDFRDDLHFVHYTAGYVTYCEEPFDQEPKSWYMSADFSGCLMAVWKEKNEAGQMMRRVGHIDTDPDWTCDRCKKLAKSKSTAEYRGSFYKPYDDRNDFDKYMALQEARKNNRPNKNLFTPPKENPKEFDSGKLFWVMKFGLVSSID